MGRTPDRARRGIGANRESWLSLGLCGKITPQKLSERAKKALAIVPWNQVSGVFYSLDCNRGQELPDLFHVLRQNYSSPPSNHQKCGRFQAGQIGVYVVFVESSVGDF